MKATSAVGKAERCACCNVVLSKQGIKRHYASAAHLKRASMAKHEIMPCVRCSYCEPAFDVEAREFTRHMWVHHSRLYKPVSDARRANAVIKCWNTTHNHNDQVLEVEV